MKLRLVENFRAVFYIPFYALKALGHAQDEGLEIEWIDANVPGGAIESLKREEAHVSWGGPMRIMKDHDAEQWSGKSLIGFCEVVGRDPFCLLTRRSHMAARLSAIEGLRVAVTSEVPTPWLCLQEDLREAGVDVAAMEASGRVRADLAQEEQVDALLAGDIDVAQVFEPYVSQALQHPDLGVFYEAAARGPTTYTVFITTHDLKQRHAGEFAALSRAMARTQRWMQENPQDIGRLCAEYFPQIPQAILQAAVSRYVAAGVWSASPGVQEAGLKRLRDSLEHSRFIKSAMLDRVIVQPGSVLSSDGASAT